MDSWYHGIGNFQPLVQFLGKMITMSRKGIALFPAISNGFLKIYSIVFNFFLPYFHNLCRYQTGAMETNTFNDSKVLGVAGAGWGGKPQQIKIHSCCTVRRNPQGNCLYNEIASYSYGNGLS